MAGSSEPAFLFFDIKVEPMLHRRLPIYFATAPIFCHTDMAAQGSRKNAGPPHRLAPLPRIFSQAHQGLQYNIVKSDHKGSCAAHIKKPSAEAVDSRPQSKDHLPKPLFALLRPKCAEKHHDVYGQHE